MGGVVSSGRSSVEWAGWGLGRSYKEQRFTTKMKRKREPLICALSLKGEAVQGESASVIPGRLEGLQATSSSTTSLLSWLKTLSI